MASSAVLTSLTRRMAQVAIVARPVFPFAKHSGGGGGGGLTSSRCYPSLQSLQQVRFITDKKRKKLAAKKQAAATKATKESVSKLEKYHARGSAIPCPFCSI